jgi:hypothetical protein
MATMTQHQGASVLYLGHKPNQKRIFCKDTAELNRELIADCERKIAKLQQLKATLERSSHA